MQDSIIGIKTVSVIMYWLLGGLELNILGKKKFN